MDIQRLRNLTTGKLHTDISFIYEDIESLTGVSGIMTHMLPMCFEGMQDWLKCKVTDSRFWDGKYDTSHQGDYVIQPMDETEKQSFLGKLWR